MDTSFLLNQLYETFKKATNLFGNYFSSDIIESSEYGKWSRIEKSEFLTMDKYRRLRESEKQEFLYKVEIELEKTSNLLNILSSSNEDICKYDTTNIISVREYKKDHPNYSKEIILGSDSIVKILIRIVDDIKEDHDKYAEGYKPENRKDVDEKYDEYISLINGLDTFLRNCNSTNRVRHSYGNSIKTDEQGNKYQLLTILNNNKIMEAKKYEQS